MPLARDEGQNLRASKRSLTDCKGCGRQSILREVYPTSSWDCSTRNVYDAAEPSLHLRRAGRLLTLESNDVARALKMIDCLYRIEPRRPEARSVEELKGCCKRETDVRGSLAVGGRSRSCLPLPARS